MSAMSELAYWQFEGGDKLIDVASAIASDVTGKSEEEISKVLRKRLTKFLETADNSADDSLEALRACLDAADFVLDGQYNNAETQGFLAHKLADKESDGMRVLAFRGTETKIKDFWSDLDATLVPADGSSGQEMVHNGFQRAYNVVRADVERDLKMNGELPLYVTGHSLGGALAIMATWFTASNSLGACYTFGGPRVGNMALEKRFKTPIYRVVNAADIVPRVPPDYIHVVISLLNLIPFPLGWITRFLQRFAGYVHFGDMRYLSHVAEGSDKAFKGLQLISNPPFFVRLEWVIRRWVRTMGKAAVSDHSITLYRRKLKAYALEKNKRPE
jgi:triacylglycerol lipase